MAVDSAAIEVLGLPVPALERLRLAGWGAREWGEAFAVRTETAAREAALPAVLGDYAVERDRLRFQPRFPLVPGLTYVVRLELYRLVAAGESATPLPPVLESRISLPSARPLPTTVVEASYPGGEWVPANLLKVYLVFSAPMRPGAAFESVRLVDADSGRILSGAFAAGRTELWDPERRRLTLLFDPGRIKRGLAGQQAEGPPLREGGRYRLEVDASWRDASGEPLARPYSRDLRVGPPDRTPPDPAAWRLDPPAVGTREALRIMFPESLDRALLMRALVVAGPDGGRLSGQVTVGDAERRWLFTPAAPWTPGRHALHVDLLLEDLAGNSLRRPFDRDLAAAPSTAVRETIPFEPRAR